MEKNNILAKLLNINRMWFNIVVITLSLFSVIIYYNVSKAKEEAAATIIPISKPPDIKIVPKYPHCTKNDAYSLKLVINKYIFDVSVCNTTIPLDLQESTTTTPITTTTTTTYINGDTCLKQNPSSSTTTTQKLTSKETRDTIIVYVAIALLLASLFAALLEAWKAFINTKKEQAKTPTNTIPSNVVLPSGMNGGVKVPTKPELTRRCSLADLTVLRHHRRESMMRRDSAMHMSIDSNLPPGAGNSHRVPLKTMGTVSIRPKLRVD